MYIVIIEKIFIKYIKNSALNIKPLDVYKNRQYIEYDIEFYIKPNC